MSRRGIVIAVFLAGAGLNGPLDAPIPICYKHATMYGGGHFLISGTLAAACSRKLRKPFPLLAAVAWLVNSIDLDHLLNYKLDDGTANSLILHPLHLYGGIPIFGLFSIGLYSEKWRPWAWIALGSYSLHLSADALAYWLSYSIPVLLSIDVLLLAVAYFVLIRNSIPSAGYVWSYFLFGALLANAVSAFIHFILKIDPQSSWLPWVVPHFFNVFLTAGFVWIFFKPLR